MIVCVDANVLIALENPKHIHYRQARDVVNNHSIDLIANDLTIGEYLVHPARVGQLDAAWLFLNKIGVKRAEVSEQVMAWPSRLALLRAETGLRMPDVVVLATALDLGGQVATFESALGKAADQRHVRYSLD